MPDPVVLLVFPGLRERDLAQMPQLQSLTRAGDLAALAPSFPCLSGPLQANLLTGATPDQHGIVGDQIFLRDRAQIVRRESWHACLEQPLIWDVLRGHLPQSTAAVWLSAFARGCRADYVFAADDGAEQGRGALGDERDTTERIESAIATARLHRPDFFYLYVHELEHAAERHGPESAELAQALAFVDAQIGKLAAGFADAYGRPQPLWLITGGYAVSPVRHVAFPNRVLHEAGLLALRETSKGAAIDLEASQAWALADRQLAHVFVAERDPQLIERVVRLFERQPGIAAALDGEKRRRYDMEHARSGDVLLVSSPDSRQACPWLQGGADAPLSVEQVKGSHGAPASDESQRSVILSSEPGVLVGRLMADTDICDLALRQFGI